VFVATLPPLVVLCLLRQNFVQGATADAVEALMKKHEMDVMGSPFQ
jgi:hypothetical protein